MRDAALDVSFNINFVLYCRFEHRRLLIHILFFNLVKFSCLRRFPNSDKYNLFFLFQLSFFPRHYLRNGLLFDYRLKNLNLGFFDHFNFLFDWQIFLNFLLILLTSKVPVLNLECTFVEFKDIGCVELIIALTEFEHM